MSRKYEFNVFTNTFDLIDESPPNKIIYTNENITVKTNTFLILHSAELVGTATITVNGTGILEVH